MNEFLEANQKLNYALNNPEKSALGEFLPVMVKHCASRHPESLNKLLDSMEVLLTPGIINSKKNYDGISEIADICITEMKSQKLEQATMKK